MAILTAVRFFFLQTSTIPKLTANSPEGLVDTAVPKAAGGRRARSVLQGSTSAVHLVSCQSVPQAPLTVPENSFWRIYSRRLLAFYALTIQPRISALIRVMLINACLEEEFADLLAQEKYCFDSDSEQCLSSCGLEYKQG